VWALATAQALATFAGDENMGKCAFVDDHHVIANDDLGRLPLFFLELRGMGGQGPH
jgi:hypothetical protein